MIDLHLHTTASDGLLTPRALVSRARREGLTTISITDHDTVAGLSEGTRAGAELGVRVIAGIEMTAIESDRDVHVLGYFIDPASQPLTQFLLTQRAERVRRAREICLRLEALGYSVNVESVLAGSTENGRSVGRPAIADALVSSGQMASRDEAFARLLGRGRPAFVPRAGASGAEVICVIHVAGGVASLAHPGVLDADPLIPSLAEVGLDALEVWHTDHAPHQQEHYDALAGRLRLLRSGGSDFHGDGVHRASRIGATVLPAEAFAALEARAGAR